MKRLEPRITLREISRAETIEYIYDLIEQLALMAHESGETYAAMHLEGILTARRAVEEALARG